MSISVVQIDYPERRRSVEYGGNGELLAAILYRGSSASVAAISSSSQR